MILSEQTAECSKTSIHLGVEGHKATVYSRPLLIELLGKLLPKMLLRIQSVESTRGHVLLRFLFHMPSIGTHI